MSDKKAQLEISANSAPAEQAFERIQHSSRRMGESVVKDGEKAGKAIDGIADGAAPAAQQLDTATKSMIASVQRTTAALQAGEKGTAKYFETLASQRGVDVSALQPYIDQLKRVEAAQVKTGISAAQTAAALRGVPAQFTDIAVSLQGGQNPLTVLLQQGGQLKDMFGGAGNAAKALGGYVATLVNPFTVAAAAAGALAVAYHQGSQEADAFRTALVSTGNAAGTSTNQLAAMANVMDQSFGTTAGKAAEVLAQFAASGQVGRASLQDFSETAIMAEKAFGTATKDIAKNFADLGKDPVGASAKLNESMNYLTASTYKQIQAAMDLGQESKAAALAQDAYNSAMKGRNAEMLASMGQIEKAWGGIKSAAKEAWDNMLGVGRPETVSSKLSKTERILKDTLERQEQFGKGSFLAGLLDSEVAQLKEKIAGYTEIERLQKRAGDSAAERVAKENAGIQAQKDGLKYLSQEQKMRNEIAQQTATMRKAGYDEAAIQERIGQIKASYDKKINGGGGQSEVAALRAKTAEAERYLDALQAQGLQADKLNDGERTALKLREELKGTMTAQARAAKEAALVEADRLGDVQRRVELEKSEAELIKKSAEENYKAWEAQTKRTDSLTAEVEKQREHNANIGLSKEAVADLTAARLQDAAAAAEQNAQTQDLINPAIAAELRAQAKLYRELATLKKDGASKEAATEAEKVAAKAAEKAAQDWQRSADKIEQSITDALMRGFENGKGFGENLRDTLTNMFKTMVLRPMVQAAVQPLANSLQGAVFGAPGQSSNMMSNMSNLSSLGSFFDTGGSLLGGLAGSSASYGAALGTTSIGAGSQAAMLAAQTAEFGTAGLSATAGAAGSGAMASMAAAAPYIAAAIMVYQLAKTLDTSGTIHTGGSAAYSAATGVQKNIGQGITGFAYTDRRAETEDMTAGIAQSVVGLLDATATSFGKTAGFTAAAAFADDSSKDGAWGSLIISKGGAELLDWADKRQSRWAPREFADGQEGLKQYMSAVATDVRDMLKESTPDWADAMLTALGDAPTLEQLASVVQNINAIQATFVQFGTAMPQLKSLTDDAVGSLLGLAGGIQNLQSGLSAYYDAFYSDAEKQAFATQRVAEQMTALGLAMPATNAEYRKLVEAQDMTTEAGRRQYAALIALAPAFAQVNAAAEQAAQAAIAEAQAKAKATADQRAGLQNQLDDLIGNSAALRERERAAIDASNLALYDQIEATKAAQAAAQQRQSLQDQLDELTGDTTALKARERAAIDASNLALYDQIQAIQAAKVAQDAYNASLDAAQSALASATASVAAAQQSVDGIRQQATSGYLSALEQVAAVQEQIADQARQTAGTYRDLAKQLREYVTGIVVPPSDSFAQALNKAIRGDREAMASLPGLATSATTQARNASSNSGEFAVAQARILSGVLQAAAEAQRLGIETPAQQAASLQQKLIDAQAKLAQALATANAISAPLVQTQNTLVTQYQAALQALTAAQSQQAQSQATLDAIQKNTKDTAMATADWPGKIAANFSQLDTSLNGLLTVDELRAAMAGKATDAQIVAMMGLLDTNNDGVISQLEAQLGAARSLPLQIQQSLAGKFDALTATTAGLLNFSQFRTQFAGLASDSTLYSIFRELDTNGDGSISRLESIKHSTEKTAVGVSNYGAGPAGVSEFERLYWAITTYGSANVDASNGVNNSVIHMTLLTRLRLEDIYNRLGSTLNVTSVNRAGTAAYFATGGVFTNSVVSRPTAFNFGVMGEAGPEAIMPLSNVGGSLGIRAQMPGTQGMLSELQRLNAALQRLQTVGETTALTSQEHLHLVRRMTRDGRAMPVAPSVNDPLAVKVTS